MKEFAKNYWQAVKVLFRCPGFYLLCGIMLIGNASLLRQAIGIAILIIIFSLIGVLFKRFFPNHPYCSRKPKE